MMTGQRPFDGMDPATVFRQHLHCEVPDQRSCDPDLPEDLCKFLCRATEKNPEARYQSVKEIIQELQPLARNLGVDPSDRAQPLSNTMTLLVSYRDEHKTLLKRFLKDVSRELYKIGAVMKQADFKDVDQE